MSKKLFYITLFAWALLAVIGCDSGSSGPDPGADGDWEAADLLDSDDSDVVDRDVSDGDDDDDLLGDTGDTEEDGPAVADGDEEPANESELADSDDVDSGETGDAEEGEAVEPGVITMEELPWEGVAVAACDANTDTDASLAASRAVWGDDRGTVYFGGDRFWIFTENGETQTLTCDGGMLWPMFSMDGRIVDNGNELWTGHDGRIGQFVDNQWSFIDLPAEMLTATKAEGDNRVVDIDIAGDVISVLTGAKLGFYNPTTHQWQISTGCPENLNRDYGLAFDGEKLWASAGVMLYTVNLQTAACQQEVTVVQEPQDLEVVGITGADEDGVWMVIYMDLEMQIIPFTNRIAVYHNQLIQEPLADQTTDGYCTAEIPTLVFPYTMTISLQPCLSVSPGMGRWPLLLFRYNFGFAGSTACGRIHSYTMQIALFSSSGVLKEQPGGHVLCQTCEVTPGCISTYPQSDQILHHTKSWRGSGTLWHLYERPRRYRW